MPLWILIPLIVIGLCLVTILVVCWRKTPQLSLLNVDTIPQDKTRQMKDRLIMQRFERLLNERLGRVGKAASAGVRALSRSGRRAVQRLYRLEQSYEKMHNAPSAAAAVSDPEKMRQLLDEAGTLVKSEEFIPAEKKYIEVISHDPKNVDAYEGLGNLYIKSRQYPQARETLQFALRLSPDDASIRMSLADLELKESHPDAAVGQLRQAVAKRPGNPKYLDAYIEAALLAKQCEDVGKGIAMLREVNPENQKLPEFETRLRALAESVSASSESSQTA